MGRYCAPAAHKCASRICYFDLFLATFYMMGQEFIAIKIVRKRREDGVFFTVRWAFC
jgi:hypothetical protein